MLHNFSRCLEVKDGFETNHLKVLYYDLKAGFSGTYRSYEYSRICTILEGEKHVTINNGSEFAYTPMDFVYLPPHSHIEMTMPINTKAIVYELDNHIVSNIQNQIQSRLEVDLNLEPKIHVDKHKFDTIKPEINRIMQALSTDDQDKSFLVDILTQELVYNMIKHNFIKQSPSNELSLVEYTLNYMHSHFNESISLSELAYNRHVSASCLTKNFKKSTGFTPKEYLNTIKMKKAKEMLSTQTVTETSYNLGYEHISHFINLFKRFYGVTPKQYALKTVKNTTIQLR